MTSPAIWTRLLDRREFLRGLTAAGAAAALGGPRALASDDPRTAPSTGPATAPAGARTLPASSRPAATGLLYDPIYKEHKTGPGHPESPDRCDAIMEALGKAAFFAGLVKLKPRAATEEEILLCHTPQYLQAVRRDVASRGSLSTGDTAVSEQSHEVALAAAGGVLNAVDAVLAGEVRNAFCVVRPPGHHATAGRGMGFCVFNNVAVAARYAQKKHALGKVLIVDWDVHHGNGTQDIFYEDGSVFFFSTHQWPLYPGTGRRTETGKGKGEGCIMNRPFPAGAGRDEIVGAFRNDLLAAVEKFRPELVLVSAGFDSRKDDPLGGFELTDEDFADLTRILLGIARQYAGGRLVSMLEGGYNLPGLGSAAVEHVRTLSEA